MNSGLSPVVPRAQTEKKTGCRAPQAVALAESSFRSVRRKTQRRATHGFGPEACRSMSTVFSTRRMKVLGSSFPTSRRGRRSGPSGSDGRARVRPAQAVKAFDLSWELELSSFYYRGLSYLRLNRPVNAEAKFQILLLGKVSGCRRGGTL